MCASRMFFALAASVSTRASTTSTNDVCMETRLDYNSDASKKLGLSSRR
jgi:hypothetical protein